MIPMDMRPAAVAERARRKCEEAGKTMVGLDEFRHEAGACYERPCGDPRCTEAINKDWLRILWLMRGT